MYRYNLPASPGQSSAKQGLSLSAGGLPQPNVTLGSSPGSAAIHALEKKRQTDEPRLPPSASEEVRRTLQLNNVCVPPQPTDSGATTPRSRSISQNSSSESLGALAPLPAANGKRPIKLLRENGEMCVSEVVENSEIQHTPTSHKVIRLVWEHPPQTVLVIKKINEPAITEIVRELAKWLKAEKNIDVLVEPEVQRSELQHLQTYAPDDLTALAKKVDLVLCLGGDGTVLHANSLFQESTPPVMAFNLGSLGFLTPFRIRSYKRAVNTVMNECYLTLRSRLFCVVVRTNPDGTEEISKHSVLNEVVIDRGSSPYLSNLECFCDDLHVTTIQADGIIVGTTTGSTAYSLSAGGSMVHPQVPAILFTPICPHSLSFRPILFPDAAELKIQVPKDARSSAWASFDGRYRTELHKNDYIIIRISRWPFVWVNKSDTVQDWFKSLAECLHWNERQKQK
jgi:NAD+ kinase